MLGNDQENSCFLNFEIGIDSEWFIPYSQTEIRFMKGPFQKFYTGETVVIGNTGKIV